MTTSSRNHRPATSVAISVAATAMLGALLAANLDSAHAIPVSDDPTTAGALRVDANSHHAEGFCFKKPQPLSWEDGRPLPPCHTYIHWTPTQTDGEAALVQGS